MNRQETMAMDTREDLVYMLDSGELHEIIVPQLWEKCDI
jgi:hypothetical protein